MLRERSNNLRYGFREETQSIFEDERKSWQLLLSGKISKLCAIMETNELLFPQAHNFTTLINLKDNALDFNCNYN